MKFVKKYIPIVLIIAGIIFVITVFMGCYNKISDEYSRIEDINIKHDICSEMARINIKDEYIKGGIKYLFSQLMYLKIKNLYYLRLIMINI